MNAGNILGAVYMRQAGLLNGILPCMYISLICPVPFTVTLLLSAPPSNKHLPSIKRPPLEPFCTKRPSLISAPL